MASVEEVLVSLDSAENLTGEEETNKKTNESGKETSSVEFALDALTGMGSSELDEEEKQDDVGDISGVEDVLLS